MIPDQRTINYLTEEKNKIGLIEVVYDYDEEIFDILKQYPGLSLIGNGCVNIGKLKDGTYIVQYHIRTQIDDYSVVKIYFNKWPTEILINTAIAIDNAESYIYSHSPTFECWECGHEKHWLDIPGSIKEKLAARKDYYCGC